MENKNQRSNWLTQIGVGPPFQRLRLGLVGLGSALGLGLAATVGMAAFPNGGLSEWQAGTH